MRTTTLMDEIVDEMARQGEQQGGLMDVVADQDVNKPIEATDAPLAGIAFTAWTRDRVYFPAVCDGRATVASAPRHPGGRPTSPIGC